MENKIYQLSFLPIFEQDLLETVDYIANVLQNETAADNLINNIEEAIMERLNNPLAFEPYYSTKERKNSYYRIYVGNYTIFYVVIENVMEVRRLIYSARDIDKII